MYDVHRMTFTNKFASQSDLTIDQIIDYELKNWSNNLSVVVYQGSKIVLTMAKIGEIPWGVFIYAQKITENNGRMRVRETVYSRDKGGELYIERDSESIL